MRAYSVLGVAGLLAGCSGESTSVPGSFVEVAAVPVFESPDVDVLFVVDDSVSVLHLQAGLAAAFGGFVAELAARPAGMPNLHIGVVTPDLGSKGSKDTTPGPAIGTGPGSCAGFGKAGALQTNDTQLVSGAFISDVANGIGTRTTNYTGTLEDAFNAIVSVGSAGCGFEQPLAAIEAALGGHPDNAGFLRPDANLAIVIVTDEDDCSFATSTLLGPDAGTLGPLQSFRCTRWGVTCENGGASPDEMNQPGVKADCHSNESSPYLDPVANYVSFLRGLKSDPRKVFVATIAGDPSQVEVELQTPPGGGAATPTLAFSCEAGEPTSYLANPAVRLAEATARFERHRFWGDVCKADYGAALIDIAREILQMTGEACINRALPAIASCRAFDIVDGAETELRRCDATVTSDCFDIVTDAATCTADGNLRLEVARSTIPAASTVVVLRCEV